MRFPTTIVVATLAAAIVAGCSGRYTSTFPIIVENRTANTLETRANGNVIGQVSAGQSASFSLDLPESNANIFSNGVAPTPQAQVTFTAKDTRTGALSSEKGMTLISTSPTYVTFDATDFPSTGPTIARFTFSPTNPTINQDVSFNGSSSTVSNGSFAWDFGDGQTGTGVSLTHRYARGGTFTVTLTVTSDTRATSTSSRTITVSTTLPATTANFTFSPTNPAINQDVVFTASTTGGGFPGAPGVPGVPGGGGNTGGVTGLTFAWDFGDGSSGSGTPVAHRFVRGGTYTVILRATTDTGLAATTSRTITISTTLAAGAANFVFSPTDPAPGDSVFFNASSSTALSPSFQWDFGDGTNGTGVTPVHSYGAARTYTVTLTVINSLGQTATTSKTVTVAVPTTP